MTQSTVCTWDNIRLQRPGSNALSKTDYNIRGLVIEVAVYLVRLKWDKQAEFKTNGSTNLLN